MNKKTMNISNLLRTAGMFAVAAVLFGMTACSSSDSDSGGSNGGNSNNNSPVANAPKAADIGWPESTQPVIDGLNDLVNEYNPEEVEEQREAIDGFSDKMAEGALDPASYLPIIAAATIVEDPATYGDNYFAAIATNLGAFSGTMTQNPETGQWDFIPSTGNDLDIIYKDEQGRDCRVHVTRSTETTGAQHTRCFDINQDVLDFLNSRGVETSRLGLTDEQLNDIANGKSIRLSIDAPKQADITMTVDGQPVASYTYNLDDFVAKEYSSSAAGPRRINYYPAIQKLSLRAKVAFGDYSLVLDHLNIVNQLLDMDFRFSRKDKLLLGVGQNTQWMGDHFTSFADMVPQASATRLNLCNRVCLQVRMREEHRDAFVAIVNKLETLMNSKDLGSLIRGGDDDDDESGEGTESILALLVNQYLDIAFYTVDMNTKLGQVIIKTETTVDEDGDVEDELIPYLYISEDNQHPLMEAFGGALQEEQIKAVLMDLLMQAMKNKMLTQFMRDPLFGLSISGFTLVPGQHVDVVPGR